MESRTHHNEVNYLYIDNCGLSEDILKVPHESSELRFDADLFPSQIELCEELVLAIKKQPNAIIVRSDGGCGQTYIQKVLEKYLYGQWLTWFPEHSLSIMISGALSGVGRPLFPWKKMLSQSTFSEKAKFATGQVANLAAAIPLYGSKSIGLIAGIIAKKGIASQQTKTPLFEENENRIIAQLNSRAKRSDLVILCDDFNSWDDASVGFFQILIDFYNKDETLIPFFEHTTFILFHNNQGESKAAQFCESLLAKGMERSFRVEEITFSGFKEGEIELILEKFGCNESLSLEDRQFLSKTLNGDVRLAQDIAQIVPYARIDNLNTPGDNEAAKRIASVVFEMLATKEIDRQSCVDVIRLASLLGVEFSTIELENASDTGKTEFQDILKQTVDKSFMRSAEDNQKVMEFAYELLHRIILLSMEGEQSKYYGRLEECLSVLSPDSFGRRARYALFAGNKSLATELFILEAIDQAWSLGAIDSQVFCAINESLSGGEAASKNLLLAFNCMISCIRLYQQHDYKGALEKLGDIDEACLTPSLSAQKSILQSYFCTKTLDVATRNRATESLTFCLKNQQNIDLAVYEHVLFRGIISFVHVGKLNKAQKLRNELQTSLQHRNGRDSYAYVKMEVLNRISNSTKPDELALPDIKNAACYFRKEINEGRSDEIGQLYKALTNLCASYCDNGQYEKSLEVTEEMQILEDEYTGVNFPRPEIYCNTNLIASFLCGKLTAEDCVSRYDELIAASSESAENIFVMSNYAIMLALGGDCNQAISVLIKESTKQNTEQDKEGLYHSRVQLNLASFFYLQGEHERALELIQALKKESFGGSNAPRAVNRWQRLMKRMESKEPENDPNAWLYRDEKNPTSSVACGPDRYFNLGFAFTVGYNWDF